MIKMMWVVVIFMWIQVVNNYIDYELHKEVVRRMDNLEKFCDMRPL